MGEIGSSHWTIYPKIADSFGRDASTQIGKASGPALSPFEKQSTEAGKKSGKTFGESFRTVAAPLLAGAAITGALALVRSSVDAYSELEDATAAAGVTFGDSMDLIQSKAEGAATALGISKQQYIDGAITMGTFGKSAGLTGTDLANFSNQLVQTAGDMASFRGTTPEEAIEAVGAALRGESEPIRKYGVLLDDASLRQEALRQGLISTTKEALTPQAKVLAAQALILKQTTDAQGDFARTSQSTANVAKTLAAEQSNLAAELGEKLAPAITAAQKAGIGLIDWVTQNQAAIVPFVGTMGTLTLAVGGFVAAAKGIEAVKAARATISGLGEAFQQMSAKARIATASAGGIGVALAALSIVYGAFASDNAAAQQKVEDFTAAVQADSGALAKNSRAVAANALQKSGALAAAQKLGIAGEVAINAALGEADALETIRLAYQNHVEEIEAAGKAQAELGGDLQSSREAMFDTKAALTEAGDAYNTLTGEIGLTEKAAQDALLAEKQIQEALNQQGPSVNVTTLAFGGLTGAMGDNTDASKKNADALQKVYDKRLQLQGGRIALEASFDAATKAAKENGKTLDFNTEKGRANRQALLDIATQAKQLPGQMERSRKKFIEVATAMTGSKERAKELADKFGVVKDKAKDLDGTKVNVKVGFQIDPSKDEAVIGGGVSGTKKISLRAMGGWAPPGLVLRGEGGPELTYEKNPTYTYTAEQTRRILSTGSVAGGGASATQIATALADVLQARGLTWAMLSDGISTHRQRTQRRS